MANSKSASKKSKTPAKRSKSTSTKTATSPKASKSKKRLSWSDSIPEVAQSIVDVYTPDIPRGKRLDYSEASLKTLDKLILDNWGDSSPTDEHLETMTWAFGCYVAQVLQLNYNGVWSDEDDGYYFDGLKSGVGVSPWSWISKRFELGAEEAIAKKYQIAKKLLSKDKRRQD